MPNSKHEPTGHSALQQAETEMDSRLTDKVLQLEAETHQTNKLIQELIDRDKERTEQMKRITTSVNNNKTSIPNEIAKQFIGAVIIIIGFGLISWRSVSVLETRFEYLQEDLASTKQEVSRVRDRLDERYYSGK